MIHLVVSKEEWERTSYPDIQPNIVRKLAGRPKTKRIRNLDEPRNPFKVSRAGGYVFCGNCKQKGHNSRGCKASMIGETNWQRRQRL